MTQAPAGRRGPPLLENIGFSCWIGVACITGGVTMHLLKHTPARWIAVAQIGGLSAFVFLLFLWDKFAARTNRRRIAEANLLTLSFLGGAVGGLAAMMLARHKTRTMTFRTLMPAAVFFHVIVIGWLFLSS